MPWCGPAVPGEFPTLGYQVGSWIEAHVVIPDGYRKGDPYRLTDEMWRFLVHFYRLTPNAEAWPSPDGLQYTGGQLRRSQKWGKDPFGAAIILAEALGPTRFDGWDAQGEPVGAPYPTPVIQCLGTSEEQTANTYQPLLSMVRNGPLFELPGLDAGELRVKLPNGGRIEPVSASARARLGQRLTFLTITESHLFTTQGGYRRLAGNVKRNAAGMDGRWLELTNAWDPTEASEAQATGEATDPRVYVDTIQPNRVEDLGDDETLFAELARQYGDSARQRGGWVNLARIADEIRSGRYMEADLRRFYLNEVVVGQSALVDPTHWDRLSTQERPLRSKDRIALGFDGSKHNDATALIACRIEDGQLFELKVWEKPANVKDWKVPTAEVDRAVNDAFGAYDVQFMFADPYLWQDYLNAWAAKWPNRVVEFPTNQVMRFDKAIERFVTAFNADEVANDGSPTLTRHFKNAVIVKGDRKKPRPGEESEISTHYLKLARRDGPLLIDAAVAGILAYAARGFAIENGALNQKTGTWWVAQF